MTKILKHLLENKGMLNLCNVIGFIFYKVVLYVIDKRVDWKHSVLICIHHK